MKTTAFTHHKITLVIIANLSLTLLSACGGGSSADTPVVTPPPATPPPAPTPSFPTQVAMPAVSVVNDNGSLVLAETGLSLYTFDNDSLNTSTCEGTVDDTATCAGK